MSRRARTRPPALCRARLHRDRCCLKSCVDLRGRDRAVVIHPRQVRVPIREPLWATGVAGRTSQRIDRMPWQAVARPDCAFDTTVLLPGRAVRGNGFVVPDRCAAPAATTIASRKVFVAAQVSVPQAAAAEPETRRLKWTIVGSRDGSFALSTRSDPSLHADFRQAAATAERVPTCGN